MSSTNRSDRHRVPRQMSPPPVPPGWAACSTHEDDGITHEVVSEVHPVVRWCGPQGFVEAPSDVSLSAVDVLNRHGWTRQPPTVQIEGGSYTLDGARALRYVLDEFLEAAERDGQ